MQKIILTNHALKRMRERGVPRRREDPLLLDADRALISAELPLKRRGYDEERLLFELAAGTARDRMEATLRWTFRNTRRT